MRFTLRENEWVLDFLNTAEWYFVYELPKVATGSDFSQEVQDSRLPPPIVDSEGNAVKSEDSEDWDEFVRPDLEEGFSKDRAKVESDIDRAEKTDRPIEWFEEEGEVPEEIPDGPMWRVRVPTDHTEEWYSTLNQSRILMNKAHNLAEDDSRYLMSMFGMKDDEMTQEKALLLAQYEFYCVIQNILVENIMN